MNKILVSLLIVAIAVGMTLPAMATEATNQPSVNTDAVSDAASGLASLANSITNTADAASDSTSGDNTGTVNVDVYGVNKATNSIVLSQDNSGDLTNTGLQAIMAGSADADSGATVGDTNIKAKADGGESEIECCDDAEIEDSGNAVANVGPVSTDASSSANANGGSADGNTQNQFQINAVVQLASADITNTQDLHQMVLVPFSQKNAPKSYVEIEDNGDGASQNGSALSGETDSTVSVVPITDGTASSSDDDVTTDDDVISKTNTEIEIDDSGIENSEVEIE